MKYTVQFIYFNKRGLQVVKTISKTNFDILIKELKKYDIYFIDSVSKNLCEIDFNDYGIECNYM